MIATLRVAGNFEKIITIITVTGTLKNIPGIPHNIPQNASAKSTTKGLTFMLFPINLGSTKFPIKNCIPPTIKRMDSASPKEPNCANASMEGRNALITIPKNGMKLNKNISKAHKNGAFSPNETNTTKQIVEEMMASKDFIPR